MSHSSTADFPKGCCIGGAFVWCFNLFYVSVKLLHVSISLEGLLEHRLLGLTPESLIQ